ncbi:MAG: CO dehydrogenase/CO-methylating acetyl-CoA synthase complex subunit beta [Oligoflexia bacterium]|nr:CO dehydrogenase/CO-methylating acetyl-CoA synthase complex subunit beta [Oligoflexia bacterium]
MSKLIAANAIQGAYDFVREAENKLLQAVKEKGEEAKITFPNTAYFLPVIYSLTGEKVSTLKDIKKILIQAKNLLPPLISDYVWTPYLGNTLNAGIAALFACEIIEALKYLIGPNPVNGIFLGAASDVIMRERGIEFVDGSAPGFAAITGAAPTNEIAVKIAKELQEKNIYVFMGGCSSGSGSVSGSGGKQFAEQLEEEGIQLGWETRLVPFGRDVSSLIYALGFANRAALSFGGVRPGDFKANLKYNQSRIFAFVLALGEVTADKYAVAAGAINYGFPVISDSNIPQILPSGVCTYEHVVSNVPHHLIVERALEVRGCKIKITKVPIPVSFGPAFEGERVRKNDVHVEFGGNRTTAFEFVTSVDLDQIVDGDIEIIGPDIDTITSDKISSQSQSQAQPPSLPLAIWVQVAGRKMQSDFEPILERQIHHLINCAEGIWHMGQRDIVWTRVNKTAFAKGFRLRHYGEILHAKFLSEYPAIVDKVKVTLITDAAEVERRVAVARQVYDKRNRRLQTMTDESVDTFYSCLLCQSFAPNHVCIITPERLGLCGAYNWIDGKAAYEIDETGPNRPVKKGDVLDPVRGIWSGVNDYVYINSHKAIKSFTAYSIMDRPMTSCGCFEVICAYVPECNGVMVVNREFQGDTPVGMTFSVLAGNVGGGQQTPGFMGCGKVFLTSKKFLFAEGGHRRLIWMPRELKELLKSDLEQRFREQGAADLFDKIADETIATNAHEVKDYLQKVGHPVLSMSDMATYAEDENSNADTVEITSTNLEVISPVEVKADDNIKINADTIADTIATLKNQIITELRSSITKDIVNNIISTLKKDFFGESEGEKKCTVSTPSITSSAGSAGSISSASERISKINSFNIRKEKNEVPIWTVKLGATKKEGGTRGKTFQVGGANCMPFHFWEGKIPHRPLVAMEVFDVVGAKYPAILKKMYNDLNENPVKMAQYCVEKLGADLISVRLDGTHPEKGNRTAEESLTLVKEILSAVDVPLIITGHNHFEKNNEVMKAVAKGCAGENLLLNWVEQDNYRTIAGLAIAYGHSLVAQSPIDVNIGKQLNLLLSNMDLPLSSIIMDPLTGAVGYGIEYTYSVMERIRLTALNGDQMLAAPMIVSPGQECAKMKEYRASEKEFPTWGDLQKRAALWELSTAISLLYAGADVLIMYNPTAAVELKKTILKLMAN